MKTKEEALEIINNKFSQSLIPLYFKGFNDGVLDRMAEEKEALKERYKFGYDEGYKKCLSEHDFDKPCTSCDESNAYRMGAEAAWNIAKRIILPKSDYEESLSAWALDEIFDTDDPGEIMLHLDPITAIEAVRKYEEKKAEEEKEIRVGDEVIESALVKPFVVTHVQKSSNILYGFNSFGSTTQVNAVNCTKTGRHFDIEGLLKQMKGEE